MLTDFLEKKKKQMIKLLSLKSEKMKLYTVSQIFFIVHSIF